MAIANTLPPLRLPPPVVVVGAVMTVGVCGVGVVWVGTTGEEGRPGLKGFVLPGWAAASDGKASAAAVTPARSNRIRSYASGCSMAGVSGASTYGCSSGTSSSW